LQIVAFTALGSFLHTCVEVVAGWLRFTLIAGYWRTGFVPCITLCVREIGFDPALVREYSDIGFVLDSIEGRSEVVKPVKTR
jgi:hypothetical protein